MSSFVKPDRPGFQQKAWLISGILGPTTAQGRCLQFQYNIDGLNVEALRFELWKSIADTFFVKDSICTVHTDYKPSILSPYL
jgi:hypothetical protein